VLFRSRLALEFKADLFEPATAERMLGHFRSLAEGAGADPAASIWQLPLLAVEERRQLLTEWNATDRDFPGGLLLHQLFEARAAAAPDLEAVVAGERRLRYGELNRRSEELARRLRGLGVRPEERVAVCLRRSEKLIVALLAVLKAGGAYVPLDPAYPVERLSLILADSGARWILGEEGTASTLPLPAEVRRLSLDDEAAGSLEGNGDAGCAPRTLPGNLAYLIYTSGSTGQPKAVAIEHRSPMALIQWARETFPPEEIGRAHV
jgi:non-ribosomal peptide synthetase component F